MTWACFSRKCICFQHHFRKSKWLFVGSDWVCLGYLEHHFVSLNFVLGMPFCKRGTCDPIFHSYIFGTQLLPLYTIEDPFVVFLQYIADIVLSAKKNSSSTETRAAKLFYEKDQIRSNSGMYMNTNVLITPNVPTPLATP